MSATLTASEYVFLQPKPQLKGSPSQLPYAESHRANFVKRVSSSPRDETVIVALKILERETSANFWMDVYNPMRNEPLAKFIAKYVQEHPDLLTTVNISAKPEGGETNFWKLVDEYIRISDEKPTILMVELAEKLQVSISTANHVAWLVTINNKNLLTLAREGAINTPAVIELRKLFPNCLRDAEQGKDLHKFVDERVMPKFAQLRQQVSTLRGVFLKAIEEASMNAPNLVKVASKSAKVSQNLNDNVLSTIGELKTTPSISSSRYAELSGYDQGLIDAALWLIKVNNRKLMEWASAGAINKEFVHCLMPVYDGNIAEKAAFNDFVIDLAKEYHHAVDKTNFDFFANTTKVLEFDKKSHIVFLNRWEVPSHLQTQSVNPTAKKETSNELTFKQKVEQQLKEFLEKQGIPSRFEEKFRSLVENKLFDEKTIEELANKFVSSVR